MKQLTLILAATVLGTGAFAEDTTTTINKEEGLLGSKTTVEQRREPSTSVTRETTTTGSVDCSTKTEQKTDEFGDTTVKRKTEW